MKYIWTEDRRWEIIDMVNDPIRQDVIFAGAPMRDDRGKVIRHRPDQGYDYRIITPNVDFCYPDTNEAFKLVAKVKKIKQALLKLENKLHELGRGKSISMMAPGSRVKINDPKYIPPVPAKNVLWYDYLKAQRNKNGMVSS